jgi:hypothetical protein
MKTNDLVLLLIFGALGWVIYSKLSEPTFAGTTPTALPSGGIQPTTATDPVSSIANAIGSMFQTIGAFAQSSPKTT